MQDKPITNLGSTVILGENGLDEDEAGSRVDSCPTGYPGTGDTRMSSDLATTTCTLNGTAFANGTDGCSLMIDLADERGSEI